MKCNVGPTDRIIRFVIGLLIAITGVVFDSYWGLIGLIVMATGIFGYCLIYPLLKLNTNNKS